MSRVVVTVLAVHCLMLIALLPCAAGEAATVVITPGDVWVRAGLAFRCRVTSATPASDPTRGPYRLHVGLVQGGATLAEAEFDLVNLGQLDQGVQVVLFPQPVGEVLDERPVQLQAILTNPTVSEIARAEHRLDTPLSLQRALEADWREFQQGTGRAAAEPALWLEQAGERMRDGASLATLDELSAIRTRLAEWRAGRWKPSTTDAELAIRDPVDDSVQPYLVHLPPGTDRVPVVLVLAGFDAVPGKARWPTLPQTWLTAARTAGVALVVAYPAGDLTWTGVAPRRAMITLADAGARLPRLDGTRVALVGSANGATGVIALAEHLPGRFTALALVHPRLTPSALNGAPTVADAGGRPAHLVALPLFVTGQSDAATSAWHARVERAGGTVTVGLPGPETTAFWSALARSAAPPAPRELIVTAPARFGTVTVDALTRWGEPGYVRWGEARSLRAVGITALRCTDPAVTITGLSAPDTTPITKGPRKLFGHATGPLPAFAEGPFVVVVGTGEHLAARRDNRTLADAFLAAWANHAQGRPPVVDDTALVESAWPRHHLVLIGNTRSNRVLATVLAASATVLPVRWDARSLSIGTRTWPRHEHRAFALAWPHPADDGRLMVVLDGAPAWATSGLPLAGLPDLLVGGSGLESRPAMRLLADGAWRLADGNGVP